jgi:PHD/YefM family antitoxin component YafN of YafNO toxin-antitoxin module
MSTTQIRQRLHGLIDTIQDDNRLRDLYAALADAERLPQEITDELTTEQHQRLAHSLAQVKSGTTVSHEAAKQQITEWLSR